MNDPDILEVFDFLNKGFTDTINPKIRNRELMIVRNLVTLEKALDKLAKYLEGWNVDIN